MEIKKQFMEPVVPWEVYWGEFTLIPGGRWICIFTGLEWWMANLPDFADGSMWNVTLIPRRIEILYVSKTTAHPLTNSDLVNIKATILKYKWMFNDPFSRNSMPNYINIRIPFKRWVNEDGD